MKKNNKFNSHCIPKQHMNAYALMEALIGLAIFTIGTLGLLAMHGNILNRNMDAGFRIQASLFANEIMGMATADHNNLNCYSIPNAGCGNAAADNYRQNWLAEINNQLPGSIATAPTITIAADRTMTITIFWQRPRDPFIHNYSMATQLE